MDWFNADICIIYIYIYTKLSFFLFEIIKLFFGHTWSVQEWNCWRIFMVWSRTELITWNFPRGSETFATYFVKIITSSFSLPTGHRGLGLRWTNLWQPNYNIKCTPSIKILAVRSHVKKRLNVVDSLSWPLTFKITDKCFIPCKH